MDDSERFEQLIAFVGAQLPKPVEEHQTDDGSFIFTGGEPAEVIVQVTESTVLVATFVASLEGDRASPATGPQPVGELHWRRLPETAVMNALSALIKGSREVRLATFRVCFECGGTRAPEEMADDDVCRECAEAPPKTVH
jgi:hypothetical protein